MLKQEIDRIVESYRRTNSYIVTADELKVPVSTVIAVVKCAYDPHRSYAEHRQAISKLRVHMANIVEKAVAYVDERFEMKEVSLKEVSSFLNSVTHVHNALVQAHAAESRDLVMRVQMEKAAAEAEEKRAARAKWVAETTARVIAEVDEEMDAKYRAKFGTPVKQYFVD